jgi:y4mF family transcriptional regulator
MDANMVTKEPRSKRRTTQELRESLGPISIFVRERRKKLGYSQEELASRTGLSLGFLKSLELGKQTVRLDKVNQILAFFGARLEPCDAPRENDP